MAGTLIGRETNARVIIHQNSAYDCLQIAAHALAVIVKNRDDAINIAGTRIARDKALNQLPADEGPDVRMIENRVERRLQILRRGLIRWERHAVKNSFRVCLVMSRDVDHRIAPTQPRYSGEENRIGHTGLGVGPARQDGGGSQDRVLVISGDGKPAGAQGQTSIEVQIVEADGK